MTSKTFQSFSFNTAEQFKESFFEAAPTITYVFVGNHVPWPNENNPPVVLGSLDYEKDAWDNMFAAKKITGNDVELVVPWAEWVSGNTYKQYDNTLETQELLSANTDAGIDQMYVITDERNVYKCLSNNQGITSTTKPSGDYTSSNGTITMADGYIWKYMFNVPISNRFFANTEWFPAPTSSSRQGFNVDSTGVVDGQITTIIVENEGSGYRKVNSNSNLYIAGQTSLGFANTNYITENMAVSGIGIPGGTYITSVDSLTGTVNLSMATYSAGGGTTSGNTIFITPRFFIDGDGTGCEIEPVSNTMSITGSIASINVISFGTGYTRANVVTSGAGVNFSARVITGPKFGHAYNPAKELNANNVMVRVRVGELDSTEGGLIRNDTSFRQIGMVRNPYKYGETVTTNNENSNTVISQTTDLTVVSGSNYTQDEIVYQGTDLANATFSGFLQSEESNVLKITRVKGTPAIGTAVVGETSSVSRTLVSIKNPEFEPYSGAVIYMENNEKVERTEGQSEIIKFVVRF